MTAPQTPAAPAKASLIEDFVEIFTAPAQVFQRRMGSNFFLMFVILGVAAIALLVLSKGVLQPAFDADWQRMVTQTMATNPQVTAAQMEQGRAFFDKFGTIVISVIILLSMLLGGLTLWLVGKLFGSTQSAGDAMMVAMYAWIPRIVGLIAVLVIAMMMDPGKLNSMFAPTLSVARFLDPDGMTRRMLALASRVDVFVIWQTVLLGIGLSVTGKIPRSKAFAAAAVVWVIGAGCLALMSR